MTKKVIILLLRKIGWMFFFSQHSLFQFAWSKNVRILDEKFIKGLCCAKLEVRKFIENFQK